MSQRTNYRLGARLTGAAIRLMQRSLSNDGRKLSFSADGSLYVPARELSSCFGKALAHVDGCIVSHMADLQKNGRLNDDSLLHAGESVTNLVRLTELSKALQKDGFECLRALSEEKFDFQKVGQLAQNQLDLLKSGNGKRFAEMAAQTSKLLSSATKALAGAHGELATAENRLMVDLTGDALDQMGYRFRQEQQADHSHIIKGRKQGNAFVITVRDGSLEIDAASFDGKACQRETEALTQILEAKGLDLALVDAEYYGRRYAELAPKEKDSVTTGYNPLRILHKKENRRRQVARIQRQRQKF